MITLEKSPLTMSDYFALSGPGINIVRPSLIEAGHKLKSRPHSINIQFDEKENQHTAPIKNQVPSRSIGLLDKRYLQEHPVLRQVKAKKFPKKISNIFTIKSINLSNKTIVQPTKKTIENIKERPLLRLQEHALEQRFCLTSSDSPKQTSCQKSAKTTSVRVAKPADKLSVHHPYHQKSLHAENSFELRLQEYIKTIRQTCLMQGIEVRIPASSKSVASIYVGRGNNSALVKETLKKRWWLNILDERPKKADILWTQLKDKSFYESGSSNPCIHNHFSQNEFLGNKKALFYNMSAYYKQNGQDVFSYLPLTFHVKTHGDESWLQFLAHYKAIQKPSVWIVKPGENSNRGNGITVHKSLESIEQLVTGENVSRGRTLIIQKYIENPLLFNKRKFDIRCYMLLVRLNGSIKGYWYKHGYIRTSCFEFTLDTTDNEYVHLTNDAIQVNCDRYGKFQEGNKLSYETFEKYLATLPGSPSLQTDICPILKRLATDTMHATSSQLGPWDGTPTFEVFGLDFLIDDNYKPWLIQVNTNPCLETSCPILRKVIPKMLDEAFRLSLDCVFPPPENWANSKKYLLTNSSNQANFELVFEQAADNAKPTQISEIGEVDEDNEVYDDDEKQTLENQNH